MAGLDSGGPFSRPKLHLSTWPTIVARMHDACKDNGWGYNGVVVVKLAQSKGPGGRREIVDPSHVAFIPLRGRAASLRRSQEHGALTM